MTPSSAIRLDNLRKMVALHETYWRTAARQDPRVTFWIEHEWKPWLEIADLPAMEQVPPGQVPELLVKKSTSLRRLRELAASQGIPIPDLSAAHGMYDDAQLNKITNERFWLEGYRPGHKLSRRDPEDVKMMPRWLEIRRQVAQEAAQVAQEAAQQAGRDAADILTSGPFDHTRSSMEGHLSNPFPYEDPLVAEINETTWQRFWDQTGYKPNHHLDWTDPADQKMHSAWLSVRYEVVRQVALDRSRKRRQVPVGAAIDPELLRSMTSDQLLAFIGEETDRRYSAQTGYTGPRPDLHDPQTARFASGWMSVRYQVTREIAAEREGQITHHRTHAVGMQSPDPWRVMQSAPPAHMMHLPMPYYQRGFIGADAPQPTSAQRTGVLAMVAPVLAPATGGFTAKVALDDHQRLNVSICVDGKCYDTSMDLAPAIAAVMSKIARDHAEMHASMPVAAHAPPMIAGEMAIGAIDDAIGAAGDAMIAALIDRHVGAVCGGWIDDIGSALKGAGSTIYKGVTDTARKLKGPITAVAVSAATAAGGPAAGAAAAKYVGTLIDKAAGSPKAAEQIKAVEQQAKTDPAAAKALTTAQKAVAHTLAAYHVADVAKKAAAGHPEAQQDLANVAQAAEQGDPAAHAATDIIHNAFSTEIEKRGTRRPGSGRRHQGKRVPEVNAENGAPTGRFVQWRFTPEQTQRFGHRPPLLYVPSVIGGAGVFMFEDPSGQPIPNGPYAGRRAIAHNASGILSANPVQYVDGGTVTSGDPWLDIVGGEWMHIVDPLGVVERDSYGPIPIVGGDEIGRGPARPPSGRERPTREHHLYWRPRVGDDFVGAELTRTAINALHEQARNQAAATPGSFVGTVLTAAGTWHPESFRDLRDLDEAVDWLAIVKRDPASFTYAAILAKGSLGPPAIQDYEVSHRSQHRAAGPTMRRGVATTQGEPWIDIVGAAELTRTAIEALHEQARSHAAATPGSVIGMLRTADGQWVPHPFHGGNAVDQAIDWLAMVKSQPATFTYAAYLEKGTMGPPAIQDFEIGQGHTSRYPAGGSTMRRDIAMQGEFTGQEMIGDMPWLDVVGAELTRAALDSLHEQARSQAAATPGGVVGVVLTPAGTWHPESLGSLNDAVDWLATVKRDPTTFTYAAILEKGTMGPPAIQDYEVSHTPQHPAAGPTMRRGVATTQGEFAA